jgi:pimeloyl-ACP methyl ester carboxylesterase
LIPLLIMPAAIDPPAPQHFETQDGRRVAYAFYGAEPPNSATPARPVAFYFHGFPASRLEAHLFHEAAQRRGLCLVAIDRPGMGDSAFQPQRRLLDFPAEVLALADQLGLERFGVLGVSGGGPYVLACCHALPSSRLTTAAIVAGLYPRALGLSGMLMEARMLLYMAPLATGLVQKGFDSSLGKLARDPAKSKELEAFLGKGFRNRPEPDREVWERDEGGFRQALVASTAASVRESAQGAAWEARLFGSDWGFALGDINLAGKSLALFHGEKDVNSPVRMARAAADLLKGSTLEVSPEDAHASLVVRKANDVIGRLTGLHSANR